VQNLGFPRPRERGKSSVECRSGKRRKRAEAVFMEWELNTLERR